eukprot:SAG31_NODE_11637_length_1011_cov_0.941886_1_plen_105_part_10
MEYQSDQFGLYLAMQVHGGMPVDFIDEDALLEHQTMRSYSVIFITQPNVPKAGISAALAWAKEGGTLVLSGGAAAADEYNETDTTIATATACATADFPRGCLHEV